MLNVTLHGSNFSPFYNADITQDQALPFLVAGAAPIVAPAITRLFDYVADKGFEAIDSAYQAVKNKLSWIAGNFFQKPLPPPPCVSQPVWCLFISPVWKCATLLCAKV